MTEHEKKLLTEKHRTMTEILDRLHDSWRRHEKVMGNAVVELLTIQDSLDMLLAASEIGNDTNTVEQTLNDPFVRAVGKRLADGDKEPVKSSVSVEAFLPGEYLRDEIKARGWTLVDAASKGRWLTVQYLAELIAGKRRVTHVTAHALAEMFGQNDAEVWLKLQEKYDEACAQGKEPTP